MFQHLLAWHCNKAPKGKTRHLTQQAVKYLRSIEERYYDVCYIPLLQIRSHKKAISTSCLSTTWKSDQPEFTQDEFYMYVFDTVKCKGHSKPFPISGLAYVNDLAISVYCPCNAIVNHEMELHTPQLLSDSCIDLDIQPMGADCAQTILTVRRQLRTLRCFSLFPMESPVPIPKFAHKARRPETRSRTLEDRN